MGGPIAVRWLEVLLVAIFGLAFAVAVPIIDRYERGDFDEARARRAGRAAQAIGEREARIAAIEREMAAVEARRVAAELDVESAETSSRAPNVRSAGNQRSPAAATAVDDAEFTAAAGRALSARLATRLKTLRANQDTAIAGLEEARVAVAQAVAAERAAFGGPSFTGGIGIALVVALVLGIAGAAIGSPKHWRPAAVCTVATGIAIVGVLVVCEPRWEVLAGVAAVAMIVLAVAAARSSHE